jgi:hypothetical protein
MILNKWLVCLDFLLTIFTHFISFILLFDINSLLINDIFALFYHFSYQIFVLNVLN